MSEQATSGTQLDLIGGFALRSSGRPADVAPSGQRLLAFLALAGRAVSRAHVAGSLWPEVRERQALGRLRTALWRLNRTAGRIAVGDAYRLEAFEGLVVDIDRARRRADQVLVQGTTQAAVDLDLFTSDLLPDWDDEWLSPHRVSFRLLRLRALEAIARTRLEHGDLAGAERAALAVVRSEPLRETAHMLLADVSVAEGNLGQAVQQLARYQRLLESELGVLPSDRLQDFVAAIRAR